MRASPTRGPRLFTDRRSNSLKVQREKLEWPKDRAFKILSLDGGGIRGLYAASLLKLVEQEILPAGSMIADYFDMIAGTSTGGIIAIALGLKEPAALIEQLYLVHGRKVFSPFWSRHPTLACLKQVFGPLHDFSVLEELLFETFGEKRFGDSQARLVVPAFKAPKTEIAVFKTDHHPDFKRDWASFAWEIARCTAAAPTYFRGHEGDDFVFLDGGIWANNPIMAAIIDALSAYDVSRDQIRVLSIGTGNCPLDLGLMASRGGLFRWLQIIQGAMYLTTDNAEAQANLLIGPQRILRLAPTDGAAEVKLDDWLAAKTELVPLARQDLNKLRSEIEGFFEQPVPSRHRFYT